MLVYSWAMTTLTVFHRLETGMRPKEIATMKKIRRSAERGGGKMGWLDTRHSFSFANYYDPNNMGFGPLRVINEDWIEPSKGFGSHSHRDMEILTYPISGELEHRDSEGNVSILRPGRIQLMRAGRGITHSEMNPRADRSTHLLQIWIEPDRLGLTPGYREADLDLTPGVSVPIASKDGAAGGLDIQQDATISAARLSAGGELVRPLSFDQSTWVQIVAGSGNASGFAVEAGDGIALTEETELVFQTESGMEILTFDLGSSADRN
jgi:redox-sensitive bicupin YhaK (pirin superfamily)